MVGFVLGPAATVCSGSTRADAALGPLLDALLDNVPGA